MATVPRIATPQTQVGAIPAPTQRVTPPRGGEAIGAATQRTGQNLAQLGALLAEGGLRLRNRQDTVIRGAGEDAYRTELKDAFVKEQTEGSDFSSEESVRSYTSTANQMMERLVSEHQGSAASRLIFTEQLQRVRNSFTSSAIARGIVSSKALIDRQATDQIAEIADNASKSPGNLISHIQELTERLANYKDVWTPEEERTHLRAGVETVTVSAMDTHLALGDAESARAVLETAVTLGALSEPVARRFRNQTILLETAAARKTAAVAADFKRVSDLGITMTNTQKLSLATGRGFPSDPKEVVPLEQTIATIENALNAGRLPNEPRITMTDAQILKLSKSLPPGQGGIAQEALFGKGERGRAGARLANDVQEFAAGTLDVDDTLAFLEAVRIVSRPDEITKRPGQLSLAVREALRIQEIDPDDLSGENLSEIEQRALGARFLAGQLIQPSGIPPEEGELPPGLAPGEAPQAAPGLVEATPGAEAAPGVAAPPEAAQAIPPAIPADLTQQIPPTGAEAGELTAGQAQLSPELRERPLGEQVLDPTGEVGEVTTRLAAHLARIERLKQDGIGLLNPTAGDPPISLFDTVELTTGPISGFRAAVAQIPFIGRALEAPEVVQTRSFLNVYRNELVRSLQNSRLFNEGERNFILESLNLGENFLQEPQNARNKLVGVARFLKLKQESAQEILRRGKVGRLEADRLNTLVENMRMAQRVLGVPPTFATGAELKRAIDAGEIEIGDRHLTPSGAVRVVGGAQ